jgi:hypothetical protein
MLVLKIQEVLTSNKHYAISRDATTILETLVKKSDQNGRCLVSIVYLTKEEGLFAHRVVDSIHQLRDVGICILVQGSIPDDYRQDFEIQIASEYLQSNINK